MSYSRYIFLDPQSFRFSIRYDFGEYSCLFQFNYQLIILKYVTYRYVSLGAGDLCMEVAFIKFLTILVDSRHVQCW